MQIIESSVDLSIIKKNVLWIYSTPHFHLCSEDHFLYLVREHVRTQGLFKGSIILQKVKNVDHVIVYISNIHYFWGPNGYVNLVLFFFYMVMSSYEL